MLHSPKKFGLALKPRHPLERFEQYLLATSMFGPRIYRATPANMWLFLSCVLLGAWIAAFADVRSHILFGSRIAHSLKAPLLFQGDKKT
jgi:hypothetical protein